MGNPGAFLPEVPVRQAITIFSSRKRKDELVSEEGKLSKVPRTQKERDVFVVSTQKQKRMMDKEVPYDKIPQHEKELYRQAEEKEWGAWVEYGTVSELNPEESENIRRNKPQLIVRSRMVYRNKHAGLLDDEGQALPTKAKSTIMCTWTVCTRRCRSSNTRGFPNGSKNVYLLLSSLCCVYGMVEKLADWGCV